MEQQFSNRQMFTVDIPNFEEVQFQRISPTYFKVILFNLAAVALIFISASAMLHYFLAEEFLWYAPYFLWAAVILLLVFIFAFNILGYKNKKYAVREQDLLYQDGWLSRSTTIIPFKRIQHLEMQQGWISKILKLKSISVFTAGDSSGDLQIAGLPEDVAEQLNGYISKFIRNDIGPALPIIEDVNTPDNAAE